MRKHKKTKQSQHFMTDKEILTRICEYANLNKADVVLEIGAGTGNLTFKIAKHAKVYAIEKDKKLIDDLIKNVDELGAKNIHVINSDALKIEFPGFNKVVANIPYAVSRNVILKLLKHKFDTGVLTVQKEFAEKLTACTGSVNYRFVTAAAQSFWNMKILEYVPRSAFSPAPNVGSAVIRIEPKFNKNFEFNREYIENYIAFIRDLFNHRNKKIKGTGKRVYEVSPGGLLKLYNKQKLN